MAISVKVGQFTKDSTNVDNATQDVTTTGFDPKAIIMWSDMARTANGVGDQDSHFSMGFSDGTNHRCVCVVGDDGVGTEATSFGVFNNGVLVDGLVTSTTIDARATVSFGTEKFTVTWVVNNAIASLVEYIAVGGADITGVQVGSFTGSGSTGSQTVTTDADCQNIVAGRGIVFFLPTQDTSIGNTLSTSTNSIVNLSFATSTTGEIAYQAGCDDGTGSGEVYQGFSQSKCLSFWGTAGGTLLGEADFIAFNSSGFEINWSDASNHIHFFMIIKGGQWQSGNETALTAGGPAKDTSTSFTPKGLFTIAGRRTAEGNSRQSQSFVLGAYDGTTEVSGGYSEFDGNTTMFYGTLADNTKAIKILAPTNGTHTIDAEADATFGTNKFTMTWTNLAASAWKFGWVVCADGPVTQTKTFTIDAILKETLSKTFSIDSILTKLNNTKTFTVDSFLKSTFSKTFTTDSILKKTLSKIFTVDSILKATLSKTFTIDALLKKGFSKTFTIDAILAKTFSKVFSADSILKKTLSKTFSIDSILQKFNQQKTFTVDAFLKKSFSKTFTIDALLKKEFSKVFSADALLQKLQSKTFTIDSILRKTLSKTFNVDSILKKSMSKTFTIDAELANEGGTSKTFTIDSILKKVQSKVFTIDAVLKKGSSKLFTSDSILRKVQSKLFSVDSILMKAQSKVFSIDAILKAQFSKTFSADSILKKSQSKTILVDAILQKSQTKTFTSDAILVVPGAKTFVIDSILKKQQSKTFTLDAILAYEFQALRKEPVVALSFIRTVVAITSDND